MKRLRIICNLVIVFCVILGIYLNYQSPNPPKSTLLYYTIQSNILLAVICAIFSIYDLVKKTLPNYMYIIKYTFTIAIVLTGVAFNLFLAPQQIEYYGSAAKTYGLSSTLLHVVTPILGLISYLLFDKSPFKKKFDLYGLIVPFGYFLLIIGLSTIKNLYLFNNLDGTPTKFPYFFLNYIDNGWFNLSSNIYELGTFYWFIIMIIFVIVISTIVRFIHKKIAKADFYKKYLKTLP